MTTQDLINTLRQGAPMTARQVKAIVSQLERIPAMERTLQRKDHDFAELSVAYSSARAECERLKEAVRWMLETMDTKHVVVSYASYSSAIRGLDGAGSLSSVRDSARKAVEELL